MFCYQCEQTAGGKGCTRIGVCGKDGETALLQDLLVYAAQGISIVMHRADKLGATDRAIGRFVMEALFTTVTNVNFDPVRLEALLGKAGQVMAQAKSVYAKAAQKAGKPVETLGGAAAVAGAGQSG